MFCLSVGDLLGSPSPGKPPPPILFLSVFFPYLRQRVSSTSRRSSRSLFCSSLLAPFLMGAHCQQGSN
ncbi:hypothetical protein GN956_G8183 [Arapaima gigas]